MVGRIQSIPAERGVVLDIVRTGARVPAFPVERYVELGSLAEARSRAEIKVSWVVLFAKAYGLAAKQFEELRQSYVAWPWPRVYQNTHSVITVSVNRQLEDGERLFFGRLWQPESQSLVELQRQLDALVTGDVKQVYKQQVRAAKLPSPLRRMAWWWRTCVDYKQRARRLGTGSISVLAGYGVCNRYHPCILTSSLSYGPLDEQQRMWVTLQCDHRVIDGARAAGALNALCNHLQGAVCRELRELRVCKSAA